MTIIATGVSSERYVHSGMFNNQGYLGLLLFKRGNYGRIIAKPRFSNRRAGFFILGIGKLDRWQKARPDLGFTY